MQAMPYKTNNAVLYHIFSNGTIATPTALLRVILVRIKRGRELQTTIANTLFC